ncbi:MAG: hypothetical protein ACYC38_09935 [Eubacteriales bacterium]
MIYAIALSVDTEGVRVIYNPKGSSFIFKVYRPTLNINGPGSPIHNYDIYNSINHGTLPFCPASFLASFLVPAKGDYRAAAFGQSGKKHLEQDRSNMLGRQSTGDWFFHEHIEVLISSGYDREEKSV